MDKEKDIKGFYFTVPLQMKLLFGKNNYISSEESVSNVWILETVFETGCEKINLQTW